MDWKAYFSFATTDSTSTPSAPAPGTGAARAVTTRGSRTRERLLDAAERLWGEHGVESVSLGQIREAAGQRNRSALQFHFGDRDGLRMALAQRHLPRVAALQETIYTRLITDGRQEDIGGLVEAMVRPSAEYVGHGPSARAWIKISADEMRRPEILLSAMAANVPGITRVVGTALHTRLTRTMHPDLATERLLSVAMACYHLCADRARLEDVPPGTPARTGLPFDRWLDNLLDMAVAAMTAPPRDR